MVSNAFPFPMTPELEATITMLACFSSSFLCVFVFVFVFVCLSLSLSRKDYRAFCAMSPDGFFLKKVEQSNEIFVVFWSRDEL